MARTFVGFGFGPIQSGLFLFEAYRSGNFSRFVVAEVDAQVVDAVRANGGRYVVNIARARGIERFSLDNIELYNPAVQKDREALVKAIAESPELATSLPAVRFYDMGDETSAALMIAEGMERRIKSFPTIVYAAENNNDAAEILTGAVTKYLGGANRKNFEALDTVIGKMSGVITDVPTMRRMQLAPMTPWLSRAILVEEFNRILVSKPTLPGIRRGIDVFVEKERLLPFEEAKLYGHNAIHALIAYLADLRGLNTVAEVAGHKDILDLARQAFLEESGAALIRRHKDLDDPLFTEQGYREYADDLLQRMVNPNLNDLVERVGRDHVRKLGWEDRLYGTMRVALGQNIEPRLLGIGAAAAIVSLVRRRPEQTNVAGLPIPSTVEQLNAVTIGELLRGIWKRSVDEQAAHLIQLTVEGLRRIRSEGWLHPKAP